MKFILNFPGLHFKKKNIYSSKRIEGTSNSFKGE